MFGLELLALGTMGTAAGMAACQGDPPDNIHPETGQVMS
jgi:hypothetical protein